MGRRHEVAGPHLEATRDRAVQPQLGRVAAICAAARTCGHAVGHLGLDHHDGAADAGHLLEGLEDDGGRHLVGQVADELVGRGGQAVYAKRDKLGREGRAVDVKGVPQDEGKALGVTRAGVGEDGREGAIRLDGADGTRQREHRHREGADARTNLEDHV